MSQASRCTAPLRLRRPSTYASRLLREAISTKPRRTLQFVGDELSGVENEGCQNERERSKEQNQGDRPH